MQEEVNFQIIMRPVCYRVLVALSRTLQLPPGNEGQDLYPSALETSEARK